MRTMNRAEEAQQRYFEGNRNKESPKIQDGQEKHGIQFKSILFWSIAVIAIIAVMAAVIAIRKSTVPTAPETGSITTNWLKNLYVRPGAIEFTISSVPQSFAEIAQNLIGWTILLVLLTAFLQAVKSEAMDRGEQKDFKVIKYGLIGCILIYFFADAIAMKFLQIYGFFSPSATMGGIPNATTIIKAIGFALLIGGGIGASVGGDTDLTPLSVTLVLAGVLIKISWPEAEAVGNLSIAVGTAVHFIEIVRHRDQRGNAIISTGLTVIIVAGIGMVVAKGLEGIAAPVTPYSWAITFLSMVLIGLGTMSTVPRGVGAVWSAKFHEYEKDVPSNIFFDMRLLVLMVALMYLCN